MKPFLATFSLIALLLSTGWSDTIILKDGSRFEGEVVSADDDKIVARVEVAKTIFERREFSRDQVAKIERGHAGEEEWAALKPLDMPGDLAPEKLYTERIAELKGFLKDFPNFPQAAKARAYLSELQEALTKIKQGGAKVDGEWLGEAALKRRALELDSRKFVSELRYSFARGRFLSILRSFHRQGSDFTSTPAYADIREITIAALKGYQTFLEQKIEEADRLQEKWEKSLLNSSPDQRDRLRDAYQKRLDRFAERQAEEKEQGQIWFVYSPFDKEGLQEGLALVKTKLQALTGQNPRDFDAVSSIADFWKAIDEADLDEARKLLNTLGSSRIPENYREPLEQAVAKLDKAIRAEKERERKAREEAAKEPAGKSPANEGGGGEPDTPAATGGSAAAPQSTLN